MKELEMHSLFNGLLTLASEAQRNSYRRLQLHANANAAHLERVNKLTALAEPGARSLKGDMVLDISNLHAAPMGSMFLAGFGTELIQVKRLQSGDEVRYWGEVRNGVGLGCQVRITGYPDSPPILLRSEPNYQDPQFTQRQEIQK